MTSAPTSQSHLQRIAAGDRSALRAALAEYGSLVWSLARKYSGGDADAEDAVQEVFTKLWQKADKFDPSRGSEVTFVSVLARRVLIDRWRRGSARPKPVEVFEGSAVVSSKPAGEDELVALAGTAMQSLDDDHRAVLRLSIAEGRSHAEIAELTGQPLGTVKSRIRNGLRDIRTYVEARTREGGETA